MKLLFPYPSAGKVLMSESFHKFPRTRVILDCTETFTQKPSALQAHRETWSSYKHTNTSKALVGITPDGTILYLSQWYGGAASGKFIVKDSGFLHLIQHGDNVMNDRSFDIRDEGEMRGAYLNRPPFRNRNFRLSSEDVESIRRVAFILSEQYRESSYSIFWMEHYHSAFKLLQMTYFKLVHT